MMQQFQSSPVKEPVSVALIRRLISVLDDEVAALRGGNSLSPARSVDEKHFILRELIGLQKAGLLSHSLLEPHGLDVKLREALQRNSLELRNHIEAVRDVSRIIIDSIKHLESDGTYSRERM